PRRARLFVGPKLGQQLCRRGGRVETSPSAPQNRNTDRGRLKSQSYEHQQGWDESEPPEITWHGGSGPAGAAGEASPSPPPLHARASNSRQRMSGYIPPSARAAVMTKSGPWRIRLQVRANHRSGITQVTRI